MRYKTMKYQEKYERLLADNKRLNKRFIELNSKLVICQQKYLSIESAFDLSQKLIQHLKTENQLLRSSTPDLFSSPIPLGPPMDSILAITDGTVIGDQTNMGSNENQLTDNNPNSDLCKSDLIAIQYEKEIKEFREECDLLSYLPLDAVVITYEDQLNAKSHLSSASESEYECDEQMDVDFDGMSSKVSKTSEVMSELKCKICGRKFTERRVLNEHKSLHESSDGQQVRCAEDFCGHQFDSKHDLKRHLKSIHRSGHKNTKFTSLKAKFQMNSSQNKRLFECKECNQEFTTIESFRLHQKSVHNVVSTFKCKFSGCDQKFEKSSELRAHEEIHRKQKSSIEFKQTPNKTVVVPEAKGSPEPTTKAIPPPPPIKRSFPCKHEGCSHSFIHKTSLIKHYEKFHPNGVISITNTVQTSDTTAVVSETTAPAVVAPPAQDMDAKLKLLNLFFSEQQKHTEL